MPGHRKRRQFKQTDAFTRGMVIGLKRAGWSIRQIAADTHLGASTVHRLWRRWLEQGNVAINRNVGATRMTSARVDRRILRQAVAAPQATCTATLQHVQDTLDHSISTRTISRRLVANGLHSCRPLRRLPLTPPNRRQRLEWCRARSTWMTEWHRVVFSDESRFCLSSDSRRVRVWRRRGEIVERPTVRQRGIMVWGAIAYDSRSPLLRIQGTMTAQRYVDDVLRPQDNARPHTARISQQALQDVQMLPWPPYSPDLSPIEHVWDIIGRRLHALPQPRSEDELWQMVEREWRAIPQDAIRTLIDSLPRRVAACIAVRGREFESHLFKDLTSLIGTNRIRTTAYNPAANGLVERLHRQIKAAIMSSGNTINWIDALPLVLLGIRTSYKEDLKCTAAEMVFGTTLNLPADLLTNSEFKNPDPSNFATQLKNYMSRIRPQPTRQTKQNNIFSHKDLDTCSHVFVRKDFVKRALSPPYEGPFPVISRSSKTFTVKINDQNKVISVNRLKPAFIENTPQSFHDSSILPPMPDGAEETTPKTSSYTTRYGRHKYEYFTTFEPRKRAAKVWNRVLTADQGEHVRYSQVEEVAVGGRLHVGIAGDDQAGAGVSHAAGEQDHGVDGRERTEPGHGESLRAQDSLDVASVRIHPATAAGNFPISNFTRAGSE
ncbi:hypothetical protein LAZ67_X000653 [Cordylochernes scorpioides]|uniref:Integrase catalytic domain-containing protein n=1 Tax=Cordylochernes scorpioides TaxID=51811 RepID=A0ABY6LWN2_9ARAC|nr:hypothetical protein LAZ67_X000653 [Cordylochernes scorpioides]